MDSIKNIKLYFIILSAVCGLWLPMYAQAQQAENAVPCIEGAEPLALVYGDHTTGCIIDPATDLDRFEFCGLAGDEVRLNVNSGGNLMDPDLVIRDPVAAIVATDSCNDNCSITTDITLAMSGCYTVFVGDVGTNQIGDYSLQVERLEPVSAVAVHVNYDENQSDTIAPVTDVDFFTFNGTVGTDVRVNVSAIGNLLDPTIEIRDPNGLLVVNGVPDGATCNDNCSFSVDFSPAVSGTWSVIVYDRITNEIGDYELSLWCLAGPCDSDNDGTPDPDGPFISYVTSRMDTAETGVDGDFYAINASVGTEFTLNVSAPGNLMDPTIELRDPTGAVVINGVADGASCNDNCSFSLDYAPAMSGIYELLIYDRDLNNPADYNISLWCLYGPCDSDADGMLDGNPPVSLTTPAVLAYGSPAMDQIDPAVDSDIFLFGGTSGDLIQINVLATGNLLDPVIEIRDPTNGVVVNGVADGASCNDSCSFTVDLTPAMTGTYTLLIHDVTTNETGSYEIGLQCLIGTCADVVAMCGDNCIDAANGPLIPDAGGNVQRDTDGDGFGNACDPDVDNNGVVNFLDVSVWDDFFGTSEPDMDFDGDGVANFLDLFILAELFSMPPGPSCRLPAP